MYLFDELQRWDSPLSQTEFCLNNGLFRTFRDNSEKGQYMSVS